MRTMRETVGFVDIQLALGGVAEQLRNGECDGQIACLEDVQHRVVWWLVAGRRRVPPRQGDGMDGTEGGGGRRRGAGSKGHRNDERGQPLATLDMTSNKRVRKPK